MFLIVGLLIKFCTSKQNKTNQLRQCLINEQCLIRVEIILGGRTMASSSSEEPRLSRVKVGKNCDYVDTFRGSGIGGGAGGGIQRRRPSHDYHKLPKLENGPSMSTEERHALYTDCKGTTVTYLII